MCRTWRALKKKKKTGGGGKDDLPAFRCEAEQKRATGTRTYYQVYGYFLVVRISAQTVFAETPGPGYRYMYHLGMAALRAVIMRTLGVFAPVCL